VGGVPHRGAQLEAFQDRGQRTSHRLRHRSGLAGACAYDGTEPYPHQGQWAWPCPDRGSWSIRRADSR